MAHIHARLQLARQELRVDLIELRLMLFRPYRHAGRAAEAIEDRQDIVLHGLGDFVRPNAANTALFQIVLTIHQLTPFKLRITY